MKFETARVKPPPKTPAERQKTRYLKIKAFGRTLNVTDVNPQYDEATGLPFLHVITKAPFAVWRIDPAQAIELANKLIGMANEAIDDANHINRINTGIEHPNPPMYTTIADNDDIRIQCRIEPAEPSK